jgi:hypothetical protein
LFSFLSLFFDKTYKDEIEPGVERYKMSPDSENFRTSAKTTSFADYEKAFTLSRAFDFLGPPGNASCGRFARQCVGQI